MEFLRVGCYQIQSLADDCNQGETQGRVSIEHKISFTSILNA